MKKHNIFISYSSKDDFIAHDIVEKLEKLTISCWIASRNISPSTHYATEIIDNLKKSDLLLLIFSKSSNSSNMVHREIERAISLSIPILPIIIDNTEPSEGMEFYISSIQWFYTDGTTPKNYYQRLGQTIEAILDKKPPPTAPYSQKKSYAFILFGVLFLLLLGYLYTPHKNSSIESCFKKNIYNFASASKLGNYYKLVEDLDNVNSDYCMKFKPIKTKGSLDNCRKVINGDVKMGTTQMDVLQIHQEFNSKICVLAQLYHEQLHIIVRRESKIKGFSQLKGKIISSGEKKSGSYVTGKFLYEYYFKEKMKNPSYTKLSGALQDLSEKKIDAILTMVGSPAESIYYYHAHEEGMKKFKLIPFDMNLSDELKDKYSYSSLYYDEWMEKEVKSISTITLLIAKNKSKFDKRMKIFLNKLNGEFREDLREDASKAYMNAPLSRWKEEQITTPLPEGLRWHSIVK